MAYNVIQTRFTVVCVRSTAIFNALLFKFSIMSFAYLIKIKSRYIKWSTKTFDTSELAATKHLKREIQELIDDLENASLINAKIELADIQMLIWYIQEKMEMSDGELAERIYRKIEVNKKRTWLKNEDGSYYHVK